LAHFTINVALYLKTYGLLHSFFKCGSRVVHNVLTKQWCKALKGGTYLWKRGARGDCLVILPNIHPWACNLSCWQTTCD